MRTLNRLLFGVLLGLLVPLYGFLSSEADTMREIPVPVPTLTVAPPLDLVEAELAQRGLADAEIVELERVTAYNPVPRQTWGDPNVSSCGPNLDNQIALSRDLFFDAGVKHLCGQAVLLISIDPVTDEIVDVRETVVYDTMHPRFTLSADVFIPSTDEREAFAWGVRRGVLVLLVDEWN